MDKFFWTCIYLVERYLTVKVKKFDLETNYFGKKEDSEKKEGAKN